MMSDGKVVSEKVILIVLVKPSKPKIVQGESVAMREGTEVIIDCLSEGKPAPEVVAVDYHLRRFVISPFFSLFGKMSIEI